MSDEEKREKTFTSISKVVPILWVILIGGVTFITYAARWMHEMETETNKVPVNSTRITNLETWQAVMLPSMYNKLDAENLKAEVNRVITAVDSTINGRILVHATKIENLEGGQRVMTENQRMIAEAQRLMTGSLMRIEAKMENTNKPQPQ